MSRMTTVKLALAAAGLAIFWYGIRTGNQTLRWTGIGAVGLAWLLRFLDPPSRGRTRQGPSI